MGGAATDGAALLTAARRDGPHSHALVALLGMIGLRVGETCRLDVTDLRPQAGYELLHVLGKGSKPGVFPLPVLVLRAVREAVDGRSSGPLLLNSRGERFRVASVAARLRRLAVAAGISTDLTPHGLRRTFCTAGLIAGVPLRDMQYAMRHPDSRTTMRYDMDRANLDRHAAHAVAAYLAGTDDGVNVRSDGDPRSARGIYAVDVRSEGAVRWASGVPGTVTDFSFPYVLGLSYDATNQPRHFLLAVDTSVNRPVPANSALINDVLVEPRVTVEGQTSLWAVQLDPAAADPTTTAAEFVLADLGSCPGLEYLVNDSWWLVHRCNGGPFRARDLLGEDAVDVELDRPHEYFQLRKGDNPTALLADGYLIHPGEDFNDPGLYLVDLRTGEAQLFVERPMRVGLGYEASVARSGWALAVLPKDLGGAAAVITLSDGHRSEGSPDPFEDWYAARSSPVLGSPVGDPEQLARGGMLPASGGALYAWKSDGGVRRVYEVRGLIGSTYLGLGGPDGSALGYPMTDELGTPDGRGRYNHFERGSVYWTPTTGAREIRGGIKDTWARLGWERSALGYPVTNELGTPDGRGRYNHFERGSVYWTPTTGAREIRGAFRSYWSSAGWERSWLGYPVTNEYPIAGGQAQDFQFGRLRWEAATGRVSAVRR